MSHQERNRLIDALLDGDISEADFLRLEAEFSVDPEARREYYDRLTLSALLEEKANLLTSQPTTPWLQWRSLTSAAAGLAIGLLGASVVFGLVVNRRLETRTPLAVFEPGFENATMPMGNGFPGTPRQWSGHAARVVPAEDGVSPKEGRFMLRIEPLSEGVPRIYQVLDLRSLPLGAGGESREIEISASFAAADSGASVRYLLRAFGVAEAPENLGATWFSRRDEAIASATLGTDVTPGAKGWQTLSVKIQVPPAARSLVLFLGVRTPDKASRTVPHYLDDVRVSWVMTASMP